MTSDHIQIKVKSLNPSHEPPTSSKAPNQELKDRDVLGTFKIKIESQNLEHECSKDQQLYLNQDHNPKPQSGTSSILRSPNSGLGTLKIKIESQNLEHMCIKDNWPYPNQVQNPKHQPGTSSIIWGLTGNGCSLQLQNEDKEQKFGIWVS